MGIDQNKQVMTDGSVDSPLSSEPRIKGLKGIDHVGVTVQDLDASEAWYVQKLGFTRLQEMAFPDAGARVRFVGLGNLRLELIEIRGSSPMAPERADRQQNIKFGGINHLALAVDGLDRVLEQMKAAGVEIVSPPEVLPDGRGSRIAFIHDNERMLIEVFERAD